MAYTNTPVQSTYRTTRVDLVGMPNGRDGTTTSKDQRFVNCFPERIRDPSADGVKYYLRERPGTVVKLSTGLSGESRGLAYFNGYTFSVIGNKVYRDTTEIQTLTTVSGRVGFTQFNGTYTALIVVDGVHGYVIKTDNTVTQITDADFPTPHLPFPVFMDGYLFLAKADTDDIYNCDLEDPLSWTPGSFITAELYPDKVMALAKNANYLVAVGEKTTEQFYDAGIASGSPLQRNDTAVQQVGTPASDAVVTSDDAVLFIGNTANGGYTVWRLKGFETKEIGTPAIRQHLTSEGTNISSASGFCIRVSGHKFYVVTTTTRTFVYDLDEEMWHEWTYSNVTTPFHCKFACDHPDGQARTQHPTSGAVMGFSDSVAYDAVPSSANVPIYMQVTTRKYDAGSVNRKQCHRLSLVGDAPNGNTDISITVEWSDDDYTTWSAARTLYMHGDIQAITQLGMFRRRAHRFTYTDTYPFRLECIELDLNIGQN